MKITVELPALVKMIRQVGKKVPGQKFADSTLRLYACAARVFVEANQAVAGMEALVLEDGSCTLPIGLFLQLLKTYAPKPHITIEADYQKVRFGSTTLNCAGYSPKAAPAAQFHVFPVTDLKALFPIQPAAVPTPPAVESAPRKEFVEPAPPAPAEDEFENVHQIVARLTRKLLSLSTATPQQVIGLARALYALERMPQNTPGVDVTWDISDREDFDSGAYSVQFCEIAVSQDHFGIQQCSAGAAAGECSESFSRTIYEEYPADRDFQLDPTEDEWVELLEWAESTEALLNRMPADGLKLDVWDRSRPDSVPLSTSNP